MADNRIASIFGTYAENLQTLVDKRLDKFKKPFYPGYFDFGIPQVTLTYATAIGRARIEAAASVVAHGSAAPLRSRATLEKLNGEVAAIKVKRQMLEKDYREYLAVQAMKVADDVKKMQILKLIWNDVEYVANAVQDRIDIMVCQALSTGKIKLDGTTNPDGLIVSDIDLLMPSGNLKTVGVIWTTTATATPLKNLRDAVEDAATKGIAFGKILMPKALFYTFSQCVEVQNALKGFYRIEKGSVSDPTLTQINGYLTAQMLPVIEIVDVVKSIEKDGQITAYRPWSANNVALVPDGKLGIIHNALAIEQISPVSGTTYATANNVLVSKWAQNEPFAEWTKGELNAFPGVEAIDSIYILQTDQA